MKKKKSLNQVINKFVEDHKDDYVDPILFEEGFFKDRDDYNKFQKRLCKSLYKALYVDKDERARKIFGMD